MKEEQQLYAKNKTYEVISYLHNNARGEDKQSTDSAIFNIQEYFSEIVFLQIQEFCDQEQENRKQEKE